MHSQCLNKCRKEYYMKQYKMSVYEKTAWLLVRKKQQQQSN